MNTLTCRICQLDVLVDSASTISTHRTSDGTIGYVRCPLGHVSIVRFGLPRVAVPTGRDAEPEPCLSC